MPTRCEQDTLKELDSTAVQCSMALRQARHEHDLMLQDIIHGPDCTRSLKPADGPSESSHKSTDWTPMELFSQRQLPVILMLL